MASTLNYTFVIDARSCNETLGETPILAFASPTGNGSTFIARDALIYGHRKQNAINPELLFGFGRALRRVVVNDAPSFREPLKNQREDPAHISGLPLQMPFSQHQRRVRS
jgi:hypothetical protein